jgi:hypothetical protein
MPGIDMVRNTPPGASSIERQVSWLADQSPHAAFPVAQWREGMELAAYSCGGSYGFGL